GSRVDGDRVGALLVPGQVREGGGTGAGGDGDTADAVVAGAGKRYRAGVEGQFRVGQVQRGSARVGGDQQRSVGVVGVVGVLGRAAGRGDRGLRQLPGVVPGQRLVLSGSSDGRQVAVGVVPETAVRRA